MVVCGVDGGRVTFGSRDRASSALGAGEEADDQRYGRELLAFVGRRSRHFGSCIQRGDYGRETDPNSAKARHRKRATIGLPPAACQSSTMS